MKAKNRSEEVKRRKLLVFLFLTFAFCFLPFDFLCCLLPSLAAQPDDLRRRAEELIKRGDKELPTRSDPRAALKFFQQSLDLAYQLNDRSLISRSLSKLSLGYIYLGELGKGLSLAEEALSAARLAGDQHQEAWALHQVGNAYFYLGDFAKALENFQAALRLMREVGDRFGEANALRDVGITYKLLGQFDEALEFLYEALDIFRQMNARGPISPVLENLGMGYASLDEYRLALDAYEQALEIARENQNAEQIYGVLTRIGYLYMDLNNSERALDHFKQALALAEELGLELPYHQAWVLQGMSVALHELGQVEAAIEAQRRSLRLDRQMKNELRVADDFRGLGHLYLDRDPAVATGYFQRALAIYEKYEARFTWGAYVGLAQAYRHQGVSGGRATVPGVGQGARHVVRQSAAGLAGKVYTDFGSDYYHRMVREPLIGLIPHEPLGRTGLRSCYTLSLTQLMVMISTGTMTLHAE